MDTMLVKASQKASSRFFGAIQISVNSMNPSGHSFPGSPAATAAKYVGFISSSMKDGMPSSLSHCRNGGK
jgi:hypothetical protein